MQLDNFSCIAWFVRILEWLNEIINLTHSLIRYYFTNCQFSKEIVQSQQFISLTLIELIGKLKAACHITIITSLMRTLIQSICMYGTPLRFSDHWKIIDCQVRVKSFQMISAMFWFFESVVGSGTLLELEYNLDSWARWRFTDFSYLETGWVKSSQISQVWQIVCKVSLSLTFITFQKACPFVTYVVKSPFGLPEKCYSKKSLLLIAFKATRHVMRYGFANLNKIALLIFI